MIWQPLALQYGKRPAYLLSLVANIIILATAPLCTNHHTYQVSRILLGLFGSPVESLCEVSITDIWFAHERPKYLAWYGWSLALTSKLAPMLSGFINVGMNWKWTLWWCAIWNSIALVYCFFLMEETNYYRKQPTVEPARQDTAIHVGSTNGSGSEKGMEAGEKGDAVNSGPMAAEADVELAEVVWPRKTYLQKLGVINQPRQNRLLEYALAPLKGFTYPAVVY